MATHSSILAWRIPWTEEPKGYSPKGCKELDTTEHTHRIPQPSPPSWPTASTPMESTSSPSDSLLLVESHKPLNLSFSPWWLIGHLTNVMAETDSE